MLLRQNLALPFLSSIRRYLLAVSEWTSQISLVYGRSLCNFTCALVSARRRWTVPTIMALLLVIIGGKYLRSGSGAHPGRYDEMKGNFANEDLATQTIFIYNQIPGTGGEALVRLFSGLGKKNKFNLIQIEAASSQPLGLLQVQDQASLVRNVSAYVGPRPAIFHGQFAHVHFDRFGSSASPVYINVVRKPLERLMFEFYYFDFKAQRRAPQNRPTFEECVGRKGHECSLKRLWTQIPHFCGQSAECWVPGSEWALREAKRNLVEKYALVGVAEHLDEFIVLLEGIFGDVLRGLGEMYMENPSRYNHAMVIYDTPSREIVQMFHKSRIWKMEAEFYAFAKEQFNFLKTHATQEDDSGHLRMKPSLLMNHITNSRMANKGP